MEATPASPWLLPVAALVGYLLGSVPYGLILTRLAGLGDIRAIGSGNIGATNVLRTGNKRLAALTLAFDALKGAAAVLLTGIWGEMPALFAGFAAVLGHNFPIWLGFRGGKGVATTIGVLTAVAWPVGLLVCATWLATALITRTSSLSALIGLAAAPAYMLWLATPPAAVLAGLLAALAMVRHHENIRRLLRGEEPKIRLGGSGG